MLRHRIGLLLRLVGPLLQLVCIAILLGRPSWTSGPNGSMLRMGLLGLFLLGFALVILGNALAFRSRRPARGRGDRPSAPKDVSTPRNGT